MDEAGFRKLLMRLNELISATFEDDEFGRLMFVTMPPDFDYLGLPEVAFKEKVFRTVVWAKKYGDMAFVLKLAKDVRDARPQNQDLAKLVQELEQALSPPAPVAAAPGGVTPPNPVFAELLASLALLESRLQDLVSDLRPKLRATSYRPYDLPGQFHLSDSEGRRLTAVLALEAEPDPNYLRWLAERVAVERPLVAFVASQALTTAALRIATADFERIRRALVDAADRLDGIVEPDDQLARGFDAASRKRQLQTATSFLEMRSRPGRALIPPGVLDQFVGGLLTAFDPPRLDHLCQTRLGTPLKRLVNMDDPYELMVVNLLVMARDLKWERDLVAAAYAENTAAFGNFRQYGSDNAAVA